MSFKVVVTRTFQKEFFNSEIYSVPENEILNSLSVSGLNKKNLLVISVEHDFLQQNQLDKILDYAKLTIDDIHLVSLAVGETIPLKYFKLESYNKILVFGVSSQQLKVNFLSELNSIIHFGGIEILFTSSLLELSDDMVKKKALVGPLKLIFNIS